MATCNTSSLLTSAKCFSCLSKKELQAVIAQLLCNISGGGAASPLTQVFSGHGDPTGVVTPTATAAIYFDEDTGNQYNWYSSQWH